MKWQLWCNPSTESYLMFPEVNHEARRRLDPDAELVSVIDADTWEEAIQARGDFIPSREGSA